MRNLVTATLLALAFAGGALAQPQPAKPGTIELRNIAEVEVTTTGPDGKAQTKRVRAERAAPGAEVIYTSTFRNIGSRPAGNIVITNPVPANTTLIGGSTFGPNTEITFSADGGKTYAPADKVRVVDASGKERPAGLTEFTHIRWAYRGELPAGKESSVGFRVTVK